jgi:hypothetical protein
LTVTIRRALHGKLLAFKINLTSEQNGRWYIILLRGAALRSDPLVTLTVENAMQGGTSIRRFVPIRFAGRTLAELFMVCATEDQSMAVVVHGEPPRSRPRGQADRHSATGGGLGPGLPAAFDSIAQASWQNHAGS